MMKVSVNITMIEFSLDLLKFLKFITILKILKNSKNLSPIDFGATYPKNLLELIEKNVIQNQKFYNTLIWEK